MDRRLRVLAAAVMFSFAPLAGGQSIFDDTWKPGDSRPPVTPGATTRAVTGTTGPVEQTGARPGGASAAGRAAAGSVSQGTPRRSSSPRAEWGDGVVPMSSEESTAAMLFPQVSWEEATRGVVPLTPEGSGAAGAATRPAGAVPVGVPRVTVRYAEMLRQRYAPLVSEKDRRDFEEVYGEDVRRAAGNPEAQLGLCKTLRAAAAELTGQADARRYVLLRAFAAARAGGAPLATFNEIGQELTPLLNGVTPAAAVQRAEFAAAIAQVWTEARQAAGASTPQVYALEGAARCEYDLAMFQLRHNYLEHVADSAARAEAYAKRGKLDEFAGPITTLRAALEERVADRARYAKLMLILSERPDDGAAHSELARLLMVMMRDVNPAIGAAGKSNEPELQGLARAFEDTRGRSLTERRLALGLALAPMAEHATGRERAALAALAVENLDAYARAAGADDPSATKVRLYLARLRPLAQEGAGAVPPAVQSIPRRRDAGVASGVEATGGAGAAAAGNSSVRAGGAGAVAAAGGPAVLMDPPARRVAFVVDGSGSMINPFDAMRAVVERGANELKPGQQFNCFTFGGDAAGPVAFQRSPVPAGEASRVALRAYLEHLSAHGSSDPIAALRAAFAQNFDAIYFITDGEFPDNVRVLQEIRRLSAARRTRVHAIAVVVRPGDGNERFMRQVAQETGGTYRTLEDLAPGRGR